MTFQPQKIDFIYKDLSFQIIGCAYRVHNELGGGQLEKSYQNAMAIELKKSNLSFIEQQNFPVIYIDSKVSKNIPDFIIDGKIIVELKRRGRITPNDFEQAKRYLKALDYKLCLLIHFGAKEVVVKRVVNL